MAAFRTPETILTGRGCFDQVGAHVARWGRRCLLVTGRRAMREQGFVDRAAALLAAKGVRTVVFDGVESDPPLATIDRGRAAFRENECDVVLGLGGGSALDAAKAIAGLAREDEPTEAFHEGRPIRGSDVPVVAAPATFGTGSEATRVSVLSNPDRRIKKSIRHDCMYPKVAVVDPLLGVGAPPAVTAACGMDALTQAVESYVSVHATDLTRALSLAAAELLAPGVPASVASGSDVAARQACANGSLMAGLALSNARLGIVHGLAHPLGARYGLAHGEACGVLLPYALRFNRAAIGRDYDCLTRVFGGDPVAACFELLRRVRLPTDLRHVGIPAGDFEALAGETLPSGSTKANPRPVTADDVVGLLRELCG